MSNEAASSSQQPSTKGLTLTETDRKIITNAKRGLEYGVELRQWWDNVDRNNLYTDTYEETFVFRRPDDISFGFFETAPLKGDDTKVIGNVQQMLYDRPKGGTTAEEMRSQVEEFVLRYFMRVSDFREPQEKPEAGQAELPAIFKYLSFCPSGEYKTKGFGYSQVYYGLRDGREGRFPEKDEDAIIDLRQLQDTYDWIVVRNPIEDFGFTIKPLGVQGPSLRLNVPAANFLVLSKDTVTYEKNPEPGVLGRYGIGYGFVKDPGVPGPFAYGPGQLEPALQLLIWEVRETGEVLVRMTFVSSYPKGLINVSLNPLQWPFVVADLLTGGATRGILAPFKDIADRLPLSDSFVNPVFPTLRAVNAVTGDAASKYFCVDERAVNKALLYIHFMQHYNAILGSLQTWRQIPNWTKQGDLPEWVKSGVSA